MDHDQQTRDPVDAVMARYSALPESAKPAVTPTILGVLHAQMDAHLFGRDRSAAAATALAIVEYALALIEEMEARRPGRNSP